MSGLDAIPSWVLDLVPWVTAGGLLLSLTLAVVTVVLLPRVVIRAPADVFVRPSPPAAPGRRVLRAVVGWSMILAGIAMMVLPGPGLVTIAAGLLLVDLPGKRAMIRRLLTVGFVLQGLNAIRARGGVPPLQLPDPGIG